MKLFVKIKILIIKIKKSIENFIYYKKIMYKKKKIDEYKMHALLSILETQVLSKKIQNIVPSKEWEYWSRVDKDLTKIRSLISMGSINIWKD